MVSPLLLLALFPLLFVSVQSGGDRRIEDGPTMHKEQMTHLPNQHGTGPRDDIFEVNSRKGLVDQLYQGDIHLTDMQADYLKGEFLPKRRTKRQAAVSLRRWANNIVYFFFDSSVSDRVKESVGQAHRFLQSRTCVSFVQSATARNRVKVFSGDGCFAALGMIGGVQNLSLGGGCELMATAAHEFTHSLGFVHTAMRSDRDAYVTVDLSRVSPAYRNNFEKLAAANNSLYVPFDYGSFMTYTAASFTNQPGVLSITPKDKRYLYTLGSRIISFYDVQMINEHYGCNAKCRIQKSAICRNGGVPNPNNCTVCNCPLGYGGPLCDQRPSTCGAILKATKDWRTTVITVGDPSNPYDTRDDFDQCVHWIQGEARVTIQVEIVSMFNSQCDYGCQVNGIEIKTDADPRPTGPRYCCPDFTNQTISSTNPIVPVITYNRLFYSDFTIRYRTFKK